ncbi:hypothetical protein ASPCAL13214 [Aspergillus calidoustus]|uniref:Suppressor of anucleate metulae protein B n=1 Tax=Aspergillus calidoustus TaxID=454130 RepID=A0A0U5GFM5_ASPCI|nr:hypothetical protein ASPCAL13214 [Aspergillus calidoustus]
MGYYKDLACLSNPKAFPSFAELPKGFSLTPAYLELGESDTPRFFFCEYVKILDPVHYRSEIEVKDKTGETLKLALCFGELQDYLLPFDFEEECETLVILNPKRTTLRDGKTEGIEITDPTHIKVLHALPGDWDNMRTRIIEANSEQMNKICYNCGKKSYKVKHCMWCRFFSYCTQRCLKEDHADECDVLRDWDIHHMFNGEWDNINFFESQMLAQTGPRD